MSSGSFDVRELTPSDSEDCFSIWQELPEHYEHPVGGNWSLQKIRDELEKFLGLGVVDASGKLVSFCLCRKVADSGTEIMLLATRARIHRSGAMRILIRSLIEELKADDFIWLEVHAGNLPAISLYESLGFQLKGERPNYYHDGGKALLFEYKRG